MPIIVSCPNCAGQLRVADDLIGRKVRCPACSTTFDARDNVPPPSLPEDHPVESEKVDAWKFLNLELADDPSPSPSSQPQPPPPPPPSRAREESSPSSDLPEREETPRRARLGDDHDDVFPCPACSRMNHRDERRCYHCGERLREDEERRPRISRRRPPPQRRDVEPHRGGFVLAMGIISLALLLVCLPLSVIPGIIGWICGQSDLRKMRNNAMDDDDGGATQAGWICSMLGTLLGTIVILACGSLIGLGIYQDVERSRRTAPPRFNPAPVPQRQPFQPVPKGQPEIKPGPA